MSGLTEEALTAKPEAKKHLGVDHFIVRFARPAIIWFGLCLMALTDVVIPCVSLIWRSEPLKLSLDPHFWEAWTMIVSLYVGGRSVEKLGVSSKITKAITGK